MNATQTLTPATTMHDFATQQGTTQLLEAMRGIANGPDTTAATAAFTVVENVLCGRHPDLFDALDTAYDTDAEGSDLLRLIADAAAKHIGA